MRGERQSPRRDAGSRLPWNRLSRRPGDIHVSIRLNFASWQNRTIQDRQTRLRAVPGIIQLKVGRPADGDKVMLVVAVSLAGVSL